MVFTVHKDFNIISTEETAIWLSRVIQKKKEEIIVNLLLSRAEQIIHH